MLYPGYVENKDFKPLSLPHFPTVQQTVIWRNWEHVPLDRLAKILQTTEENVLTLARNMGLRVPPAWEIRLSVSSVSADAPDVSAQPAIWLTIKPDASLLSKSLLLYGTGSKRKSNQLFVYT